MPSPSYLPSVMVALCFDVISLFIHNLHLLVQLPAQILRPSTAREVSNGPSAAQPPLHAWGRDVPEAGSRRDRWCAAGRCARTGISPSLTVCPRSPDPTPPWPLPTSSSAGTSRRWRCGWADPTAEVSKGAGGMLTSAPVCLCSAVAETSPSHSKGSAQGGAAQPRGTNTRGLQSRRAQSFTQGEGRGDLLYQPQPTSVSFVRREVGVGAAVPHHHPTSHTAPVPPNPGSFQPSGLTFNRSLREAVILDFL